jgi:hypothetical protein
VAAVHWGEKVVITEFFPTSTLIFMMIVGAVILALHPSILAAAADHTMLVKAVLTPCLVVAALFVILSKEFAEGDKRWAYGVIGTVAGCWLKHKGWSSNVHTSKRTAMVR